VKNAGVALGVLFALLLTGLAYAQEEEEDYVLEGIIFSSDQSASGIGIANSYLYLAANPQVLRSHSSGSGAYDYESTISLNSGIEVRANFDDYLSTDRNITLQEHVSAANAAVKLDLPGSFRSMPINSLWRDDARAENIGGAAVIARFGEARSLSKEVVLITAGTANYDDLVQSQERITGSSYVSMALSAAFNGTARLGMDVAEIDEKAMPDIIQPSRRNSRTLIDEVYRGSFSIEKKMQTSVKKTATINDDDWLPCCFGGYLTEPTYYRKGEKGFGPDLSDVFDCTCVTTPANKLAGI
jgi:hypothetical protein